MPCPDDCFCYLLLEHWIRERNAMNTHEEGFDRNNRQWLPAAV